MLKNLRTSSNIQCKFKFNRMKSECAQKSCKHKNVEIMPLDKHCDANFEKREDLETLDASKETREMVEKITLDGLS